MKRTAYHLLSWVLIASLAASVPAVRSQAEPPSKLLPKTITRETVRTIDRGLVWLERCQRQNGSWGSGSRSYGYPMVMTSLASLALMANGSTPESGTYSRSVARSLNWVLASVESFNDKNAKKFLITSGGSESRSMYSHGFGMLFLAQCYGVEGDKNSERGKRLKKILDRGVALTVAAQSDLGKAKKHAGGWTYSPNQKADEGSVTVTQLQALRACRDVGIKVPKSTIARTVAYLKLCQQPDGGICYSSSSIGRGYSSSQPAVSAAAIACFYAAGVYDRKTGGKGPEAEMVERLVAYCKSKIGSNIRAGYGHSFYTSFYMAQGMYQRGAKDWAEYFPSLRDQLIASQSADGNWQGDSVGTVYGTALACMILQLPYGYLPVFER